MQQQWKNDFPLLAVLDLKNLDPGSLAQHLELSSPHFIWQTPTKPLSYIGLWPQKFLQSDGKKTSCWSRNEIDSYREELIEEPLETALAKLADEHSKNNSIFADCAAALEIPFIGGGLGLLAYDSSRHFEKINGQPLLEGEPELIFLLTDTLLVINEDKGQVTVLCWPEKLLGGNKPISEANQRFTKLLERINQCVDRENTTPKLAANLNKEQIDLELAKTELKVSERFSREQYIELVIKAKEYILAGDVFQVVLSNSFECPFRPNPYELYQVLRKINPSPYHFLMQFNEKFLVGASPELMLRGDALKNDVSRQQVIMRLVAGTYPRNNSHEFIKTSPTAGRLLADEKERAEHMMLVDHARNDIGRVSEIACVEVKDLLSVETYSNVYHIVSQVGGLLRKNENFLSALRSCFPIATLTGTPKIRAMEIIAELEGQARGFFGGTIFCLGLDACLDSAVVIRSATLEATKTCFQAGGGIVYDSLPEREYQECYWKTKPMLQALWTLLEASKQ